MKVYLAHNFAARNILAGIIKYLKSEGIEVTSSWITDDSHLEHNTQMKSAVTDLEDIEKADSLVLFTDQYGSKSGKGKFLELGYALRAGKRCILVGEDQTSCVFYYLPNIVHCKTIGEAVRYL